VPVRIDCVVDRILSLLARSLRQRNSEAAAVSATHIASSSMAAMLNRKRRSGS
jgi:hypothetical protein